ncbi:heptaprenylglyceryl phosphate synthase [Paenibacillus apis]|nr:heptaprenylglyceryl phosphate synthase [Paenibacillus apis]
MENSWRHVFKLDPDRTIGEQELEAVCTSGSDAIIIGGSSGVTYENTEALLERIRRFKIDCALEVSELDAIVPGFDLYLIPMVLNTQRPEWLIGHHARAIEKYGPFIPWDRLLPEGYIVLNPEATVARITEADTSLDAAAAAGYAGAADKLMQLPIIYVEYSGRFGDMELVGEVRRQLAQARLFYGGGITNAETARQATTVSDTVVVGNVIYSDLAGALATVEAVKGARSSSVGTNTNG